MKFLVTAVAINRATGHREGEPRTEGIDTDSNDLFKGTTSPWKVEDIYETFWNRLNPRAEWNPDREGSKIVVLKVEVVN